MFELPDRRQQLNDYLGITEPQRQQYKPELVPPAPNPLASFGDFLGHGLEMVGRPGRAVRTAIDYGTSSRNPLEGFMTGLQGGGPASFAEVLQNRGVGTQQFGPLDTRGIAGFGLDVATDPLTYIPVGGILAKLGIKGAEPVLSAARMANRHELLKQADTLIRSAFDSNGVLSASPEIERGLPGFNRVLSEISQGIRFHELPSGEQASTRDLMDYLHNAIDETRPSESALSPTTFGGLRNLSVEEATARAGGNALTGLAQRAASTPIIGDTLGKLLDSVSGNLRQGSPVEQALRGYRTVLDNAQSVTGVQAAAFQRLGVKPEMDELGRIALPDGTRVAWNDLFMNPAKHLGAQSDQQPLGQLANSIGGIFKDLEGQETAALDTLRNANPNLARNLEYDRLPLEDGAQYIPRAFERKDGSVLMVGEHRVPGKKPSYMFERNELSMEELIQKGFKPLTDWQKVVEGTIAKKYQTIATAELLTKLSPLIQTGDLVGKEAAAGGLKGAIAELRQVDQAKLLVKRALDGDWNVQNAKQVADLDVKFPGLQNALAQAPGNGDIGEQFMAHLTDQRTAWANLVDEARNSAKAASKTYAGQIEGFKQAGLQRFQTIPAFRGAWLQPEDAASIARVFEDISKGPNDFLRGAARVSGMARGIQTGLDFGAGFLQGLPTLVTHPADWLYGQFKAAQAFADPSRYWEYLQRPDVLDVLNRAPGLATNQLSREFYGAFSPDSLVGKVLTRPEAAFSMLGTALRVEGAKALLPTAEKSGPQAVGQMVNYLNHITGAISLPSLGLSANQIALERTFLYSSMYTRATLALAGDILNGGLGRTEALKAIGSMLVIGTDSYIHLAQLAGQKPVLDPRDSRFLTLDVNGERMGPGSVWVAAIKLAGKVATNPGSLLQGEDDNPLIQFWRGRLGPAPGALWDIADGETLTGTPLASVGDVAKYLGTRMAPMAIAGLVQDIGNGNPTGAAEGFGASLLGLRAFPHGTADIKQEVAQRQFGAAYQQLDPFQRADVYQQPELKNRPLPEASKFAGERERSQIFTHYSDALETAATQVSKGQITKAQFRAQEAKLADARNTLLGAEPEVTVKPSEIPLEQERQQYLAYFKQQNEYGQPDYQGAEAFYAGLPGSTQQYIEDKQLASYRSLGPQARALMEELWQVRKELKPYWAARDTALERKGILDDFQNATPAEQQRIVHDRTDPLHARYQSAERLWSHQRELLKRTNVTVDRDLMEWYGETPAHAAMKQRAASITAA